MSRTNTERRADAAETLLHHCRKVYGAPETEIEHDPKNSIADMVTDLMHYAKGRRVAWAEIMKTASVNFNAEKGPCSNCRSKEHGIDDCEKPLKGKR